MTSNRPDARFWIVSIVGAVLILVFPMLAMRFDLMSQTKTLYSLIPLLLFNPVISVVVTYLTARSHGAWVGVAFLLLAGAFFASVFITYNASALVYFAFVAAAGMVGAALGTLSRRKRQDRNLQ